MSVLHFPSGSHLIDDLASLQMSSFSSDIYELSSCDCCAEVHVSTKVCMAALCDFYIKLFKEFSFNCFISQGL